jgi:hypothetical protein
MIGEFRPLKLQYGKSYHRGLDDEIKLETIEIRK